jgi:hypothetical protein
MFWSCSDDETTDPPQVNTPLAPTNLYTISGDEEVTVFWSPSEDEEEEWFEGYNVYIDMWPLVDADEVNLEDYRVNDLPLTDTTLAVTLPSNSVPYFFHARAVSKNGGLSDPSNEVEDAGRPFVDDASICELLNQFCFSGYDFSDFKAVSMSTTYIPETHEKVDVFLDGRPGELNGALYLRSPATGNYFQDEYEWRTAEVADMGEYEMDDFEVSEPPESGYADSQLLQTGHVYAVIVHEEGYVHYVKMRVTGIVGEEFMHSRQVNFEFAYQAKPDYPNF